MTDDNQNTRTEKGASLARGAALILGTILLGAPQRHPAAEPTPARAQRENGQAPIDGQDAGARSAS